MPTLDRYRLKLHAIALGVHHRGLDPKEMTEHELELQRLRGATEEELARARLDIEAEIKRTKGKVQRLNAQERTK